MLGRVQTGLQRCQQENFAVLQGLRVGAIVNPTSVDADFVHLADLLTAAPGVQLKALFGPEHGIRGEAQYMVSVDDAVDLRTGVPVYSLYGSTFESLSPRGEWLAGLDALVFDIQDVGSRYYTYVYTMALAMKAAAKAKLKFFVLDRPNPLGGSSIEGNAVGERFRSFVGLYSLPNRHGMTAGELAKLFNQEEGWGLDLTVVPCDGWRRGDYFDETGLPFIPPSPNMPTLDTALVYPGMCFLEGTNVSEGRGTCRPFEQFGAPWLEGDALVTQLSQEALSGVKFRAVAFTPSFDKFRGERCGGAMMHVTDRDDFRPVRTALAIVRAARALGGPRFQWRADAYEFVRDIPAFDLLCGTDTIRQQLESEIPLEALVESFDAEEQKFAARRAPFLLYK